jgi:hypothetical protein
MAAGARTSAKYSRTSSREPGTSEGLQVCSSALKLLGAKS